MMRQVVSISCAFLLSLVLSGQAAQAGGLRSRVEDLEAYVVALESLIDNLVLGPAEQLATVRSLVLYDGSIHDGDGFTVIKKGVGDYFVGTGTIFSDTPTVLVQALGTDGAVAYHDGGTKGGFVVKTKNAAGTAVDRSFRFIAVGPKTLSP